MNPCKLVLPVTLLLLNACSFVEPTSESSAVSVITDAAKVEACKKLGSITSSVLDKVGFMERSEGAMTDEIMVLAKNKAAEMGADTIIPKGAVKDGAMSFDVYNCGN